jgi:hypothetical protein
MTPHADDVSKRSAQMKPCHSAEMRGFVQGLCCIQATPCCIEVTPCRAAPFRPHRHAQLELEFATKPAALVEGEVVGVEAGEASGAHGRDGLSHRRPPRRHRGATVHYWQNLFVTLVAEGFTVALLNPLRTRLFSELGLERERPDASDAVGIARFAVEKRPPPTRVPDPATEELRELVRFRDRMVKDFVDRKKELQRLVDLGFPEFTRHVKTLESELGTAVLTRTRQPPPFRSAPGA